MIIQAMEDKIKNNLTHQEREFASLVSRAAFSNPFSDDRNLIDIELSGISAESSRQKITRKVAEEVAAFISRFEAQGKADINYFSGRDKKLVERVFLFDFFYKFKKKFDTFTASQIKAGDTPIKIPFFNDALSIMLRRGFSEEYFRRYFALCYQLRRAYYFIDRSLVGNSPCMKNLRLNLWNNVFTSDIDFYDSYLWNRMEDFSTLILGETGTGKGAAAFAIGRSGFIPLDKKKKSFAESFTRTFISINLSQFSETLIESELFGHKKGAFTGASEDHKGVFDRCSPYGAILLDEIGDVSVPVQIKLLQVLQERSFTPVGSKKQSRFHGRVISATNRSVEDIRRIGSFRDDFYYRLCSDIITVPPLRQRIKENNEELHDQISTTVHRILGEQSDELVGFVEKTIEKKLGYDYPWPGNVRELEQCVRRILLKGDHSLGFAKSSIAVVSGMDDDIAKSLTAGEISVQNLVSAYCFMLYQRHQTFEEVARRTSLDRRTVKKYILEWGNKD